MKKIIQILVAYSTLSIFLSACSPVDDEAIRAKVDRLSEVTIHRDDFGTPHVFADDNYGVYFGFGYAVAEDRLFQMEMLKRTTQGKVAEVLGEKYLSLDTHIRTGYDHHSVREQLANLAAGDVEILQAYADGFNHRIDEVLKNKKTVLPLEFGHYDFLPSRWEAYDVAMIFIGSIAHRYSDFNSELDNNQLLSHLTAKHGEVKAWNIFNASKWLVDNDSPTTVPRENSSGTTGEDKARPTYLSNLTGGVATKRVAVDEHRKFTGITDDKTVAKEFGQLIKSMGYGFSPEFSPASNFWAVNKTGDVKAALVNGPQFGFGIPSYVYGIGLHGGDFNVVGNTLLGLPSLLFAHNNKVGWGSTAGLSDQVDVFVEKLNPKNPHQYFHAGQFKDFKQWQEVINVRGKEPVTVIARRSVHGMVQQFDKANNVAYTRARAWEGGELASLFAWINLAKDQSLDEVQARLSGVTTNINFYYMDAKGGLGYTHGGRYPNRHPQQDSRLPTPGTGEWDWRGYRSYEDNPNVRNPEQGYIANWNNRPQENWASSDLWTYTWGRGDRAQFIFDEIEAKKSLTVDQVWEINRRVSFNDVSAPFLLPYLMSAWKGHEQTTEVKNAIKSLQDWDQTWQLGNQGRYPAAPTIMEVWLKQLLRAAFIDDIGERYLPLYMATNNPNNPLGASMGTGPGVKALIRNLDGIVGGKGKVSYDFFNDQNPLQLMRSTFQAALKSIAEEQGAEMSGWTLAPHPMTWQPTNFRGVPQALPDTSVQLPAYMNRGSENNLFIATGTGISSFDVIPAGQSGFIAPNKVKSAHFSDQLKMYAEFTYKPVVFDREAVVERSVSSTQLKYSR